MAESVTPEETPARQPAPSSAHLRVPPPVSAGEKWRVAIYDGAGHKVTEAEVSAGTALEIRLEEA